MQVCMAIKAKCYRGTTIEELMADAQNEQIREAAPDQLESLQMRSRDWRTAYCRLKEEGDDNISGEEERERDWCWQVCIFYFLRNSLQRKLFSRAMVSNTATPQLNCQLQAVKFYSTPLTGIKILSCYYNALIMHTCINALIILTTTEQTEYSLF